MHMAQLMPLPLAPLASVKSRLVLPFWYRPTWVVPDKGPLNGCVFMVLLCRVNVHVFHPLVKHNRMQSGVPGTSGSFLATPVGQQLPCRLAYATVA